MSDVDEVPAPERDYGPETAFAGRFDPLEMPIILEILREHGIFAITKASLEDAEANAYPLMGESRKILLVDRERLAEAKRIIDEEIPARLEEMRAELGEDPDELPEGLAPFGWFSPEVARVFLALCADSDVRALAEYPLDAPPPPYARADGRVRIHVEALLVDVAEEILDELAGELTARGVVWEEPLRGDDET